MRELLVGDDFEYADSGHVLLERTVGSILVRQTVTDGESFSAFAFGVRFMPIVRMGLLVVEDAAPNAAGQLPVLGEISLWDNDHLQEYEWMWLWQSDFPIDVTADLNATQWTQTNQMSAQLDLRVRRRLERKDRLVLLASYVTPGINFSVEVDIVIDIYPMLRTVCTT